jgi:hypothetical protein
VNLLCNGGGIEYAVSFVPHNATEYNFDYSVGYLTSICIYRFPMPHWTEKSVAKAVSPFGALVAEDPVSFSDTDFSTISIIVHVECISKIPRLLVVKQGGHGTLAWIDIVDFLDLSLPPSPPPPHHYHRHQGLSQFTPPRLTRIHWLASRMIHSLIV